MKRLLSWFQGILSCCLAALLATAVGGASPAPSAAQSIVAGEVDGRVSDPTGASLARAGVVLIEARTGMTRQASTDAEGRFSFGFVPYGTYHVRVEILGHRPALVTDVPVGSGRRVAVPVTLVPEPPPVTQVDTVRWGTDDLPYEAHGDIRRIGPAEMASSPTLRRDLAGLVALSSAADDALGLEGLPGGSTALYADGEPFRPAGHPRLTGRPVAGLPFPRLGLAAATVGRGLDDVEWAGTEGGIVALESRGAAATSGGGGFGLWAGDALWSGEAMSEVPGLASLWGGAEFSLPLVPDKSLLALSLEGMRLQSPLVASAVDTVMAELRPGDAPPAGLPGIRETTVLSGTARVDWALDGGGHVTVRAGVAGFQHQTERPGTPLVAYGAQVPNEGVDGSVAGSVGAPLTEDVLLEVRGGVGFSTRDYQIDGAVFPGAWVVGPYRHLGSDPSFAGSFSRVDVGLGPVLHVQQGPHRAKGGLRVDFSSYDDEYVEGRGGAFVYGSADAVRAGRGAFQKSVGSAPSAAYSVPRFSAFGQYRWNVLPGLDLTTGVRFEQEMPPSDDVRLDSGWLERTGIVNNEFADRLRKLDGRLHLRWDLTGNGRTWLVGGLGIQSGVVDPAALSEVLTLDGPVRAQRGLGGIGQWPSLPDSASAPVFGTRLAMFGPDLEAPRTARGAVRFSTALGGGVALGLAGSFRRTEFLLRRRDLNRLAQPVGTDQDGRPLYGPLEIVDGVLGADPSLNRRFGAYESVWALDADGWSEYGGVTVSLGAPLAEDGSLVAEYTYSETVDNLVGAASARAEARLAPALGIDEWDEALSDFDRPHRMTVSAVLPLPLATGGTVAGVYRFRSGAPFTPMVAAGLDANGDGSAFNDVARVPASGAGEAAAAWDCIAEFGGSFPDRNSCRGEGIHTLDLRLAVGLLRLSGGATAELVVDALNITDADTGRPDPGLLTVAEGGSISSPVAGEYQVPYAVNPRFGSVLPGADPGRWLRIGLRIGGGS